ncbi:MAG: DUF4258 domain-containing protein [Planctomycetales bacterium]
MADWPDWWDWELELSPHLLKRMIDRNFSEADLRLMMERATSLSEDYVPGRWIAVTTHDSDIWEVIIEPDVEDEVLVVITAYPVEDHS